MQEKYRKEYREIPGTAIPEELEKKILADPEIACFISPLITIDIPVVYQLVKDFLFTK